MLFPLFRGFFCEIFRSGIEGVDKRQWEAGAALGMSKGLVLRRMSASISEPAPGSIHVVM